MLVHQQWDYNPTRVQSNQLSQTKDITEFCTSAQEVQVACPVNTDLTPMEHLGFEVFRHGLDRPPALHDVGHICVPF